MNFCLIFRIHMTSHRRTTTTSSISIPFAGKVFPQPARCRKNFLNPEIWIFMLQEETYLFLIGKKMLSVMAPILHNKDVFEPSYND